MKRHSAGRARWAIAMVLACLSIGHAVAQGVDPRAKFYTQGEWALLPEWCIDSQDGPYGSPDYAGMNKSPRAPQWMSLMGTDFWHMHHYCRALRDIRRAQQAGISRRDRDFVLARAVSDLEYTIGNCNPRMPLMPEVLLKLGEVQLMRSEMPQAQLTFERARELKPDYWPAYERWIKVLIDLKQWDTARKLVEEGLSHSPNQPALLEQFKLISSAGPAKPRHRAETPASKPR